MHASRLGNQELRPRTKIITMFARKFNYRSPASSIVVRPLFEVFQVQVILSFAQTEAQRAYKDIRVHCIGIGCEYNCLNGNKAARFRTHLLESPACVTEIERVLSSLDAMGEKRKESPMIIWMKRRKWLPEGSPHHVSSTKKK